MAILDFFKLSSPASNGDISDSAENPQYERGERKTSIVESNNALVTGSEDVRKREFMRLSIGIYVLIRSLTST